MLLEAVLRSLAQALALEPGSENLTAPVGRLAIPSLPTAIESCQPLSLSPARSAGPASAGALAETFCTPHEQARMDMRS